MMMVRTAGKFWLVALLGACGGSFERGGAGEEQVPTEVADVLSAAAPQVVIPAIDRFAEAVIQLRDAVEDWDGGEDRASVQEAWQVAMLAWQECEVHQIGPTASALVAPGGKDLRDTVYSWPTVNPCRVDQETVAGDWVGAYFDTALVNVRGLDALEHLLFVEGTGNGCPSQVSINSDGTWSALGDSGVRSARANHARALADDLLSTSASLQQEWAGFGDALAGPGTASSPYATSDEALTAIFHGLFYVETGVKDRKLAAPLGLRDCGQEQCPESVEHLPSGLSIRALEANMVGFRSLFTGGEGAGMDDLLIELGHGDLTEAILQATDGVEAALPAVDLPIDEALSSDLDDLEALHSAVGGVTDLLKNDLTTVLSLEIPAEAAGDND